jgi:hypothetical protein
MRLGVSVLVGVALAMFVAVFFRPPGEEVKAQSTTDPVFVGAGDIARCLSQGDEATAELLAGIPGTIFTTGDNAYENGSATDFQNCYGLTWGEKSLKDRTMPVPGNHEYNTLGAKGYFD